MWKLPVLGFYPSKPYDKFGCYEHNANAFELGYVDGMAISSDAFEYH